MSAREISTLLPVVLRCSLSCFKQNPPKYLLIHPAKSRDGVSLGLRQGEGGPAHARVPAVAFRKRLLSCRVLEALKGREELVSWGHPQSAFPSSLID